MKHTNTGCGAVVGVALATLWLAIVWFGIIAGRFETWEDGSGTYSYLGTPVAGYCLPFSVCNKE